MVRTLKEEYIEVLPPSFTMPAKPALLLEYEQQLVTGQPPEVRRVTETNPFG